MFDDGAHGDGTANDEIYGAQIPAQFDGTIIEFYLEASDAVGYSRTWPAPSIVDGEPEQVTNALYQVNNSFDGDVTWLPGRQPVYYLIMTEMEKDRLLDIGDGEGGEHNSDAQMNATFISVDGVDVKVRHNLGVRNRGHGSRDDPPNNYRLNFPHDRPWKGITAVNLNTKYTYYQLAGNMLFPQKDKKEMLRFEDQLSEMLRISVFTLLGAQVLLPFDPNQLLLAFIFFLIVFASRPLFLICSRNRFTMSRE